MCKHLDKRLARIEMDKREITLPVTRTKKGKLLLNHVAY